MEPSTGAMGFDTLGVDSYDNGEFMKQLGGSGVANLLTAALFALIWIVKNKCRHSECEGSSFCCTCKVKDDEDSDEGERVPGQAQV